MQSKWNSYAWLVGTQNGAGPLENYLTVSFIVKQIHIMNQKSRGKKKRQNRKKNPPRCTQRPVKNMYRSFLFNSLKLKTT